MNRRKITVASFGTALATAGIVAFAAPSAHAATVHAQAAPAVTTAKAQPTDGTLSDYYDAIYDALADAAC